MSATMESPTFDEGRTQEALPLEAGMAKRQQRLADAAAQLKRELHGIDDVIDRVIDGVRAWYVLPQIITRPVIVCLWGLTGTGKTQLTRRLAQLLGFYDRFVEVQMDGFSNGSGSRSTTISGMLGSSDIPEGEPGILVLDEFQRFRTVDERGKDMKVMRYQDVWVLLSDGRLPPALGTLQDVERKVADMRHSEERSAHDDEDDDGSPPARAPSRFRLDAWDAQDLRQTLKLKAPLLEIMEWPAARVHELLQDFQRSQQSWETDYSRLLIFVCGNLDEMYDQTAQRVEDCDTDADIFHQLTSQLSIIDVKKALSNRFRPEQIARLGNHHVIYPSFSRATYELLIRESVQRYIDGIASNVGLRFRVDDDVLVEIYDNAVFPAQGTRPLFSSVHAILSASLIDAALWAINEGVAAQTELPVTVSDDRRHLVVSASTPSGTVRRQFAVPLELNRIKQRANRDFRALLAVHEAGHGLIYSLLFGRVPQEIKINIASFKGGYNSFCTLQATTRQNSIDMICVGLAGRAAEALVFGELACTTGAEQDYKQATEAASRHLRHHGFGDRISRTDVTSDPNEHLNTDVGPSNAAMEALLREQYERAGELLRHHAATLKAMANALTRDGLILPADMVKLLLAHGIDATTPAGLADGEHGAVLEPFAAHLDRFGNHA
ncbi:AAA family ATPase [Cupriavidus pauculus]|nr:AAA family ATPase [Cupriavidus pauculus]